MGAKNLNAMTDLAIAKMLLQRIEQLRLERNISQQSMADELGITVKSYRNFKTGKVKLESLIGMMRVLSCLELVEDFIPQTSFSPMELMKLKGQERQRASRQSAIKNPINPQLSPEDEW